MATIMVVLPTTDLKQYFNLVVDHKTFVCAMNTLLGYVMYGKATTIRDKRAEHAYSVSAYVDLIDQNVLPQLLDDEGNFIMLNRPVFESFKEFYEVLSDMYHDQLVMLRRHIEQTMAIRGWRFVKHFHNGMLLAVDATFLLPPPGQLQ